MGRQIVTKKDVEARPKVMEVIADAFALAYGTGGEPSITYWAEGAALALAMLIEAGWLPASADPRARADNDAILAPRNDAILALAVLGEETVDGE